MNNKKSKNRKSSDNAAGVKTRTKASQKAQKDNVHRTIRYAVIGLGHIAQHAVLPAFTHAKENSKLVALISGSEKKLNSLGKRYEISNQYHYDELETCLEENQIDALYVATPNATHSEFVLRGIRAGVHVLCEKPLGINAEECKEFDREAHKNNVHLMTAYRLHFDEANMTTVKLLRTGEIGEPKIFSSVFSYQVAKNNVRTEGKMGGGSLTDIGIYAINAARYVFQDEPIKVAANMTFGEDQRFNEIDGTCSALLLFPDNKIAQFTCSFAAGNSSNYEVIGTKGKICLESAYEYEAERVLTIEKDEKRRERKFKKQDQFAAELIYFSNCILNGKPPEPSAKEGLADLLVIDAIRASSKSGKFVPIKTQITKSKPNEKQIINRPSLRKPPRLIQTQTPHPE